MAAPVKIGELLISQGVITEKQLQVALEQQKVTGAILGDLLIKLGFITAVDFAQTIAVQAGMEYFDLANFVPEAEALRMIPKEIAEKAGLIPLMMLEDRLAIGITVPSNILAVDTATKATGKQPKVYIVDKDRFDDTLEKSYYFISHPILKRMQELVARLHQTSGTIPGSIIAEITELIIMDAIRRHTTDIHITPAEDVTNVFYRIDGVLQHGHCLTRQVHNGIVSRIKIMAQLDIADQRLPQDGAFSQTFFGKTYETRVSTVPSLFGENVVLRLLAGAGPMLRLESLGITSESIGKIRRAFNKSYGIILIVGPTGSGKTTTLYAALRELSRLERNILTVEDPVEYRLSFVRQTQVNVKAGYTFAAAAKTFMRQDPDVMLLGEIRDEETAQMAVRASITGHLVISTLHTNDAVTAIPRLLDLNVDTSLLSSALAAVLAQRLVRKICNYCKEEYSLNSDEIAEFLTYGISKTTAFRGKGCEKCGWSGFMGRLSVCEVLVVSEQIRQKIFEGASTSLINEMAIAEGMTSLYHDGVNKAAQGLTTLAEIARVAG